MIPGLSDKNVTGFSPVARTYNFASKQYTFESGRLARLAQGASVISDANGNLLLTTAGINPEAKSASFFPLTVEFVEKFYASGKIGGNRFMKREGRPSESAILNSRLIDRPIRPMFPKGVQNEVQVIATILSSSNTSDFGFWGITGASLSFMLAGVSQFEGPVAGVRIAQLADNSFVFDPTFTDLIGAKLDLTVAGTADAITMVESQAQEVDEKTLLSAFEFASKIIGEICAAQLDFIAEYRASLSLPVCTLTIAESCDALAEQIHTLVTEERVAPLFYTGKGEFYDRLAELETSILSDLGYNEESE